MSVPIIVQARMGSKRFPGKIMAPFLPLFDGGPRASVLEHVLRKFRLAPEVRNLILATPAGASHSDAWELAKRLGWDCFAGRRT